MTLIELAQLSLLASNALLLSGLMFVFFAYHWRKSARIYLYFSFFFLLLVFSQVFEFLKFNFLFTGDLTYELLFHMLSNLFELGGFVGIAFLGLSKISSTHQRMLKISFVALFSVLIGFGVYTLFWSTGLQNNQASFLIEVAHSFILLIAFLILFSHRWKNPNAVQLGFMLALVTWLLAKLSHLFLPDLLLLTGVEAVLLLPALLGLVTFGAIFHYYISRFSLDLFETVRVLALRVVEVSAFLILVGAILLVALNFSNFSEHDSGFSEINAQRIAQEDLLTADSYIQSAFQHISQAQSATRLSFSLAKTSAFENAHSKLQEVQSELFSVESDIALAENAGASVQSLDVLLVTKNHYRDLEPELMAFLSELEKEKEFETVWRSSNPTGRKQVLADIIESLKTLTSQIERIEEKIETFQDENPAIISDRVLFYDFGIALDKIGTFKSATNQLRLQLESVSLEVRIKNNLSKLSSMGAIQLPLNEVDFFKTKVIQNYAQNVGDILREQTSTGSRGAAVRSLAADLVRNCSADDLSCRLNALYRYVADDITYINDPRSFDSISTATETLLVKAGDCDDKSVLLASLLESIGLQARILYTQDVQEEGHVFVQALVTEAEVNNLQTRSFASADPFTQSEGIKLWLSLETTISNEALGFQSQDIIEKCENNLCREVTFT